MTNRIASSFANAALALGAIALLTAAWGCASAKGVPEGPGKTSKASRERMQKERERSIYAVTRRAAEAAEAHPDDLRLQRKAARLAAVSLGAATAREEPPVEPEEILGWTKPALERLANTGSRVCATRGEAARVYEAAGEHARAAKLYAETVRTCNSAGAALGAARAYRHADDCDRAIEIVEVAWPNAEEKLHVPLLDAVNRCSSEVNLQQNLTFVPETVVEEYMELLEDREQRARERRRAARRAREQARRRRERRARVRRCERECRRATSECYDACSTSECRSHCRSREHACMAQCR